MIPSRIIILLSGLPAVGKSTYARYLSRSTASLTTTWSAIHAAGPHMAQPMPRASNREQSIFSSKDEPELGQWGG